MYVQGVIFLLNGQWWQQLGYWLWKCGNGDMLMLVVKTNNSHFVCYCSLSTLLIIKYYSLPVFSLDMYLFLS